ncbi:MAG: NUDIX domain-containing protein [archaeon]
MEDPLLDTVDGRDHPIGSIRQSIVYRHKVNYRVVHIFIFDPEGRLLLQRMRVNHPRYPGYWGSSAAGFVHHTESYDQAAKRIVEKELGLVKIPLYCLGRLPMVDHGNTKFVSAYQGVWDYSFTFDPLKMMGLDFVSMEGPGKIVLEERRTVTPTFRKVMSYFKPFLKK